jgi:hypothetical protein
LPQRSNPSTAPVGARLRHQWLLFHSTQPITFVSHSFSTAFEVRYIQLSGFLADNSNGEFCL